MDDGVSHQRSAALAECDVGPWEVDGGRSYIGGLGLATLLVLGHDGEGRDLGGVADRHQRVGARAHEGVHDAVEGVVVGVARYVTHAHPCRKDSQDDYCTAIIMQLVKTSDEVLDEQALDKQELSTLSTVSYQ